MIKMCAHPPRARTSRFFTSASINRPVVSLLLIDCRQSDLISRALYSTRNTRERFHLSAVGRSKKCGCNPHPLLPEVHSPFRGACLWDAVGIPSSMPFHGTYRIVEGQRALTRIGVIKGLEISLTKMHVNGDHLTENMKQNNTCADCSHAHTWSRLCVRPHDCNKVQ